MEPQHHFGQETSAIDVKDLLLAAPVNASGVVGSRKHGPFSCVKRLTCVCVHGGGCSCWYKPGPCTVPFSPGWILLFLSSSMLYYNTLLHKGLSRRLACPSLAGAHPRLDVRPRQGSSITLVAVSRKRAHIVPLVHMHTYLEAKTGTLTPRSYSRMPPLGCAAQQ